MVKRTIAAKMHILLLSLTLLSITGGQPVDQQLSCDTLKIVCTCGKGEDRRDLILNVQTFMMPNESGEMQCSVTTDLYHECANHNCAFKEINRQHLNASSSEIQSNYVASVFPQVFSIPSGGSPEINRFIRRTEPCRVIPLKFASIKCWKWPNWKTCDITCNYGHGFLHPRNSTPVESANINCRSTENVWKPHGFIDCKPYLNCHARLIRPGELKCKQPLHSPAYCDIACLDYEDFKGVPMKRYECKDETFRRSLPQCAVMKTGHVQLMRKPGHSG